MNYRPSLGNGLGQLIVTLYTIYLSFCTQSANFFQRTAAGMSKEGNQEKKKKKVLRF